MKRRELERHLQTHGCHFLREGSAHSIWVNPQTGHKEEKPFPAIRKSSAIWLARFAVACQLKFPRERKLKGRQLLTLGISQFRLK
jgi:hypothetical protein